MRRGRKGGKWDKGEGEDAGVVMLRLGQGNGVGVFVYDRCLIRA